MFSVIHTLYRGWGMGGRGKPLMVQGPIPAAPTLCTRHLPRTCSNWTSLYRNPPDMFKLVQIGPHRTGTPPDVQTRSNWTSLYRDPPNMFRLVDYKTRRWLVASVWNSFLVIKKLCPFNFEIFCFVRIQVERDSLNIIQDGEIVLML